MSESEPPSEETRLEPIALPFRTGLAPRLTWSDKDGAHTRVVETRILVGSSQDAGLILADPLVSRIHAELESRSDGLWVRDLGSRNGTFVDGLKVTGALVPDRGRLRLGGVELVVEYDSAPRRPVQVWPHDHFGQLVGTSTPMRELFATLHRVAPMDASVLVHGETGTGKELVAQAIHDASPRATRPFVVVDCAALPENLLDAELFGHAKGAFTGATGARIGAIEAASGGTVFLDEIGELPITMQPKLLRVLESRMVRRVGETSYRDVDVRFISATHRDLLTMVNAGEFREDLYFRLAVLPVEVPALRARRGDIERLVTHFLGGAGRASPDLMRELLRRPWRGNVRELRNFVERARALGASEALALSRRSDDERGLQLESEPGSTPMVAGPAAGDDDAGLFSRTYKDFREAWVDRGEREYVRRLLARHDRNVAAAAREAGVDRTYVYRLIRKHEL